MVHFSLVLGLFCKVLTQDPGTLERADADPRFSCIADLVENNESPQRFCPYCEVRRMSEGQWLVFVGLYFHELHIVVLSYVFQDV